MINDQLYAFRVRPRRCLDLADRRRSAVGPFVRTLDRGNRLLVRSVHEHDRRAAPPRTGQARTQRTGTLRRGYDGIELRRAALVQTPTRFVRLIQQLAELPELALLQQLRREPRAGGLAHDVHGARTQWLAQRPLETRQPLRRPARQPLQLRQFDLETFHRLLALRAPFVEPTSREIVTLAGIDEQEPRVKRDLRRLERRAFEQQRVIALAERRDRLIHHPTPHADMIVLGTERDA